MHRNRGLGQVQCELKAIRNIPAITRADLRQVSGKNVNKDEKVIIRYRLTAEEPLMLSGDRDNISETMISGRRILGALAGRYPADGNPAGSTVSGSFSERNNFFSNAYPEGKGQRSVPAPAFLQQLKKTKLLINSTLLDEAPQDPSDAYCIQNGNQTKKLRKQYVLGIKPNGVQILETQMKMVYHHRHKHRDTEPLLYSHLVIAEGQSFCGEIQTTAERKPVIEKLLGTELRIGKSKTAQYGKCRVSLLTEKGSDSAQIFKAGEILLAVLSSDLILNTEHGNVTNFPDAYRLVAEELGISGKTDDQTPTCSIMDTDLFYGYQTVWNLRRKPTAVIKAGSVFAYHLKDDIKVERKYIGERNLEGFGEVCLYHLRDLPFRLGIPVSEQDSDIGHAEMDRGKWILDALRKEERIRKNKVWIQDEEMQRQLNSLTASSLGRITLMLRESMNISGTDQNAVKQNFQKRIGSIKTRKTREIICGFVKKMDSDRDHDLSDCWADVLLTGLTYQKYKKSGRKGEKDVTK